ncbi:Putative thiosulfate sulfurtransferase SseB [Paraconexibacter sp. AEG42_29]|uniref:Thiosulfate sulfurtransferase SseB n=1 Tax=Paraconexibacter sp. AEG42_29 TaxID=2997339 RepID=A0AAU7ARL5_9ACTN
MIPPIVDVDWWLARREQVVTADVRFYLDGRSARAAYDAGHIPGAVFVDLAGRLATHGAPADGRHPLPSPEDFAAGMSAAGIGDGDVVVAYDDTGGTTAARLVWMLRALGHDAALLDGGLAAFAGELETAESVRPPATFTARPWPADRLATIDDAAAAGAAAVVLDARDLARYTGEVEPVDPQAGHIPGARSLPCREHLTESGRFVGVDALRERFAAVGVTAGADVISYCGSGVTACHNLLALEHAGLGPGRLYPGSWSAYSNTPDRPVATGESP